MRRSIGAALAIAVIVSSVDTARADPQELARRYYSDGARLYEQHDYLRAIRAFERAYEISGSRRFFSISGRPIGCSDPSAAPRPSSTTSFTSGSTRTPPTALKARDVWSRCEPASRIRATRGSPRSPSPTRQRRRSLFLLRLPPRACPTAWMAASSCRGRPLSCGIFRHPSMIRVRLPPRPTSSGRWASSAWPRLRRSRSWEKAISDASSPIALRTAIRPMSMLCARSFSSPTSRLPPESSLLARRHTSSSRMSRAGARASPSRARSSAEISGRGLATSSKRDACVPVRKGCVGCRRIAWSPCERAKQARRDDAFCSRPRHQAHLARVSPPSGISRRRREAQRSLVSLAARQMSSRLVTRT